MSDSKVFMFPDSFGGANAPASAIDPNLLLALNNNGGFGNNGNWLWIFFLFLLYGRNGWNFDGQNGVNGMANNEAARELFMQGINGNRAAIDQLSTIVGCKFDDVNSTLCALMSKIDQVGNQVGLSGMQTINAVNTGNAQLQYQLSQCCCELKTQLASCCCDIKEAVSNVGSIVTRGFADTGYALRDQTCTIEKAIESSTSRIIEGQRAAELREMQNKIDALRDANLAKDNIIAETRQTQVVGQMIAQATTPIAQAVGALQADVNGIKCKLPETVTLPYSCATAVPTQAVLGYNPFNVAAGWNYGCGCGNSLWG